MSYQLLETYIYGMRTRLLRRPLEARSAKKMRMLTLEQLRVELERQAEITPPKSRASHDPIFWSLDWTPTIRQLTRHLAPHDDERRMRLAHILQGLARRLEYGR